MLKLKTIDTNKKEPNGSLDKNKFVALEGCGQGFHDVINIQHLHKKSKPIL